MLLHVLLEPGNPFGGHGHAVDTRAAVHHARGLVVAHRHRLGHARAGFIQPVDEHEGLRRGKVQIVAFGFVVKQLEREPRMQPLRAPGVFVQQPRGGPLAFAVGQHADRLPFLGLPAVIELRALHHDGDGKARIRH